MRDQLSPRRQGTGTKQPGIPAESAWIVLVSDTTNPLHFHLNSIVEFWSSDLRDFRVDDRPHTGFPDYPIRSSLQSLVTWNQLSNTGSFNYWPQLSLGSNQQFCKCQGGKGPQGLFISPSGHWGLPSKVSATYQHPWSELQAWTDWDGHQNSHPLNNILPPKFGKQSFP